MPGIKMSYWLFGEYSLLSHNLIENTFLEMMIFFLAKLLHPQKGFGVSRTVLSPLPSSSMLVRDSHQPGLRSLVVPTAFPHCYFLLLTPAHPLSFHALIPLVQPKDPVSTRPAGGPYICIKHSPQFIIGHLVHHTANSFHVQSPSAPHFLPWLTTTTS